MSASPGRAVVLAAVVLLVTAGTAGTAGAFSQPGTEQVDVDADSTRLNVAVQPDGDATWEVVYRIRLDDENSTEAFEDLRQDIQNDSTPYTDRFGDRMRRIANSSENATGREMEIRNVTVETRSQVDYGFLVYEFEWTNFAAVDGDTVRAGDAIDQFYLDSETTLSIGWPDGYVSDSVTPSPTRTGQGEAIWEGELDFDPGEPRVVMVPQGETPVPPGDGTTTTTPATGGGDGGGILPIVAGVVVLLAIGAGIWLYTRRGGGPAPEGDESGAGAGGAAATAATATAEEEESEASAGPPMELLSNEEKVLRLVEENGGRMKQKKVAEDLDWTAAKTSQVVSSLRDEDKLESFRLGRENVLTLPDVDLEPSGEDEIED